MKLYKYKTVLSHFKWHPDPTVANQTVCSFQIHNSFMHYVFTQFFRYSQAMLHCASLKAEVCT
ncbi:hypothetical protein T10_9575 [Trichinella papuae]|uniref:Uncharacterized protein n=1 Tax=Trichinella papuae TaxID=268474 RepID=A0A0V1MG46_9BILA|nr:hypothetical protein T10_9575 [Trichinella papuae]